MTAICADRLAGAVFDIAMASYDPVKFEGEAEQAKVGWTFVPPRARAAGFERSGSNPRTGSMRNGAGPARERGERFILG